MIPILLKDWWLQCKAVKHLEISETRTRLQLGSNNETERCLALDVAFKQSNIENATLLIRNQDTTAGASSDTGIRYCNAKANMSSDTVPQLIKQQRITACNGFSSQEAFFLWIVK